MDTWIHGYPFSLDTWIFGYFGYQFFSLSRFWISYPSIRIFLDTFLNYHMWKNGNQIQVLRLCSIFFQLISLEQLSNWYLASVFSPLEWKNFQAGALFVRLTS